MDTRGTSPARLNILMPGTSIEHGLRRHCSRIGLSSSSIQSISGCLLRASVRGMQLLNMEEMSQREQRRFWRYLPTQLEEPMARLLVDLLRIYLVVPPMIRLRSLYRTELP